MQIINKASRLFVLTSTILMYIENPVFSNPDRCLTEVLTVLKHSHITRSQNPMQDLDLLYTCILSDVLNNLWPITH